MDRLAAVGEGMATPLFPLVQKVLTFNATTDGRVIVARDDILYVITAIDAASGSGARYGNSIAPSGIQGPIFMMPYWLRKRITFVLGGLRDMSGSGYAAMSAIGFGFDPRVNQWGSNAVVLPGATLTGGQSTQTVECTPHPFVCFSKGTISTGAVPFSISFKFAFN